jgi:hypothetical protein
MSRSGVLFIVAETGGRWPRWVSDLQREVHDVVVVAGDPDGTPAELALRVLHRLESLESSERRTEQAVVLAGVSPSHDEVFEARCLIARALLKHMAPAGTGGLVYSAPSALPDDSRHELMALVGTLTEQLVGTQLSISIRFGDGHEARRSHPRASRPGFGQVA